MNFTELPAEILCDIFNRLQAGSALNFALSCRLLNDIFDIEKSNLIAGDERYLRARAIKVYTDGNLSTL